MAPLHVTALLLACASCGALLAPPRSPRAPRAPPSSSHRHARRRERASPSLHHRQSDLLAETSSSSDDRWPVLPLQTRREGRERYTGVGIANLQTAVAGMGALVVGAGALTAQAAHLSWEDVGAGVDLPRVTSSVVASPRGGSHDGNSLHRGQMRVAPFGVSAAYAADDLVATEGKSAAEKALRVQYDGPGESMGATKAKERDLYVEFDRPGEKATSPTQSDSRVLYVLEVPRTTSTTAHGAGTDLYVQYDGPSRRASSKRPPSPEPRVVLEDGQPKKMGSNQRAPEPELNVVLEQGPPRRRRVRPPPELTVQLEQTALKRVEAPPDTATESLPESEADAVKALPAKPPVSSETKTEQPTQPNAKQPTKVDRPAAMKSSVEVIRPEALTYIKEYNAPKSTAYVSTSRAPPATKVAKAGADIKKSALRNDGRASATARSSANALAALVNNAEAFSFGVGAGIVALITRQRIKEQRGSEADGGYTSYVDGSKHDTGTDENEQTSRRPYLDSLSVVSSAGQGQRSYLDELSESNERS